MRRTLFKFIALFPVLASFAAAAAFGAPPTPTDALRTPDRIVEIIDNSGKDSYDRWLAAYRQAIAAHPDDAGLAVAACRFSEHFGESDELPWAADAWRDFNACQAALQTSHAGDTDAELFLLDRKYGKAAIEYGETLAVHSQTWPAPQQARLHAALSHAYMAERNYESWGKEALLALRLDPGSDALVSAVRYLVWKRKPDEAATLLASAPLPKSASLEAERIRIAATLLPGTEAKDELLRAQRAGLDIDRYTAARALAHVGDAAGANALLNAAKTPRQHESDQNRQFRLDVALDANDARTAAAIIQAQYADRRNAMQLIPAYAHLVGLAPSYLGHAGLVPIAASCALLLLGLVATPGLLMMFPVHYFGTVRRRLGKPCAPLFERIGLRHAWLALAILLTVLYVVALVRVGGGGTVKRIDWQQRVAVTHLWTLLFGAIGLACIGRLLSWREWLGSGAWQPSWALRPAALLACGVLGNWLVWGHGHVNANNVPWAVALVHGAESLGGVPLALLIMSVLVPVMEELVFRGAMLGGLTRHVGFGWANALQALTFASLHQDTRYYVYLILFGAIAGWLARQTRGLAMPILFHAVNNAIFVFWVTVW